MSSWLADWLRDRLPDVEDAHELACLSAAERRELFRLAEVDGVTQARYEAEIARLKRGHLRVVRS